MCSGHANNHKKDIFHFFLPFSTCKMDYHCWDSNQTLEINNPSQAGALQLQFISRKKCFEGENMFKKWVIVF